MDKATSIYLNFLRFFSAMLVFVFHAKHSKFDGAWLNSVGGYGHDAVIVFFVLSGFVITYITSIKQSTFSNYSKDRLARLYSVVAPALLLTLILDFFGKYFDASMYTGGHYQSSDPVQRFLANIFFINEIWFSSWRAFSNGPFWSLSYEFWYYAIYGVYFYFTKWKRFLFIGVTLLIAGPKILILFPIWIMGAATFHFSKKMALSKFYSLCFVITPVAIYCIYRDIGGPEFLFKETADFLGRDFVYKDLKWSREFVNDYIVGALLAIHLLGITSASKWLKFSSLDFVEQKIRYFSNMTFALYLLHFPFLQFYGSFINQGVIIVFLAFLSVLLLAPYTEGKKKEWRKLIDVIIHKIAQVKSRKFD